MSKWQNVDAGPRQLKDLQRAVSDLNWEAKTHVEVTGVIGGTEHRCAYTVLGGVTRADVIEAGQKIMAKYDGQVSKKNVRAIIADYGAATAKAAESRPEVDNRRTAEADAEVQAKIAERKAGYQAKREREKALLAEAVAKAPAGAQALIVASYHEDTSDPMTDYFANKTTKSVAIGFRFGKREDFRQLRWAAAQYPETAHLAGPEAFELWLTAKGGPEYLKRDGIERRDNYSMGKGNYLSDHGWDGTGTGWVVKSYQLPARWAHLTDVAIPEPERPQSPEEGSGITVCPSSIGRPGVVEVHFDNKPAPEVIVGLKARGFRWARGNRCWYGTDAEYAKSLVEAAS